MNANEPSEPGTADDQGQADTTQPGPQGMQALADLLAADEPVQEQNDGTEANKPGGNKAKSSGSDEQTTLTKFNDLAGATEMELDALYKLEVSLSDDDEPVTIEQLKDSYKERADFDLKVIEFEEQRTQQEQDLMRAKSELQEILQALPKNAVKPEVLERIRAKSEETTKQERQKTLEVIPEWKDADKRQTDIAAMAEHLQGYGFPANYLQQVVSHQHLKYIRDNMLRERRIREAIAKVRSGKPAKTPTSTKQGKPPRKGAPLSNVNKGSHRNKLEAVFSNVD